MDSIIDRIKQIPLFHHCSNEELQQLMAYAPYRLRHKKAGEHIAYTGDKLTNVILLLKGTVFTKMTHINDSDKNLSVEFFPAPSILASGFIFSEDNHLLVDVICETDCELLFVNHQAFDMLLESNKGMMMDFIYLLSNRVNRLCHRTKALALHSLKEQVIIHLQRTGEPIKNVEKMARVFGVPRPSLSRVLGELRREGVIERTIDGLQLKKGTKYWK